MGLFYKIAGIVVIVMIGLSSWFKNLWNASDVRSAEKLKTEKVFSAGKTSFHTLSALSLDGEKIDMSRYKGKKVVVLNVASKCGYTPQYADWQKFYESHNDRFEVLGFPCNQFMEQEPGTNAEIGAFCQKNYGVTFQMFDKVDVKGSNQHPVYRWLSTPELNGWNDKVPSWNFCKYLIDEEGNLTHFFGPKIKPDSPEFLEAIQKP
jgi:glutathione peroxidase